MADSTSLANSDLTPGASSSFNIGGEQKQVAPEPSSQVNQPEIIDNSSRPSLMRFLILLFFIVVVVLGLFLAYTLIDGDGSDDSDQTEQSGDSTGEETTEFADDEGDTSEARFIFAETSDTGTFATVAQDTDLWSLLNDTEQELTIFVPDNEAFSNIQSIVDNLLSNEDQSDLENVLSFHIVDGNYTALDLVDITELEMRNGESVTVSVRDGGVYLDESQVVEVNLESGNKIVHILDSVLIPEELQ